MKKRLALVAILMICMLPMIASGNAQAQNGVSHPNNQCTVKLAPLAPGQKTSKILESHCYSTFAEAIAHASGGLVHLSSNAQPQDLTQATLDAAQKSTVTPLTSYVLSVEYWDWHYQGATLSLYGDLPCNQVSGYSDTSLGSWNDEISSSIGYNYCDYNTHWQNSDFTGSYIICEADCYEMGSMNDQTSAIEWQY